MTEAAISDVQASNDFSNRDDLSLESELATLAGHIHAATFRMLQLIAELESRGVYAEQGAKTMAHWLSWRTGIDLGAAREKVRVAKALPELPRISEAMRTGELSYSKARALTRIATQETEEGLLDIAHYGTTCHVEKLVRSYRRVGHVAEAIEAKNQHDFRALSYHHDESGMVILNAQLPPEAGAVVIKALEAYANEAFKERQASAPESEDEFVQETHSQRMADALVSVSEAALANEESTATGGDQTTVVVHVDADVLQASDDDGDIDTVGASHIQDGSRVSAETSRRLACDSAVVTITESDGTPLDVGRKTRTIPPALKRALRTRDDGCRFPGCTHTRFTDAHHIEHWADGGQTKLENLVTLCRHHHRFVHEAGWRMDVKGPNDFAFHRPSGELMPFIAPAQVMSDSIMRMVDDNAMHGVHVSAETCRSRWQGDRMDTSQVIEWLALHDGGGEPLV